VDNYQHESEEQKREPHHSVADPFVKPAGALDSHEHIASQREQNNNRSHKRRA